MLIRNTETYTQANNHCILGFLCFFKAWFSNYIASKLKNTQFLTVKYYL